MSVAELTGKKREGRGKGYNRKLRAEGELPAVVYGRGANVSLSLSPKQLRKVLDKNGINTLIQLSIEGDSEPKRTVVLKDHLTHPYKDQWLHADFYEVDMSEKIKVNVPIRLIGHSPGEKMGGMVEHHLHDLEIRCLPTEIPESFDVEMSEVQLDQVVHVSDLKIAESIEVMVDPGDAVVAVHEVKVKEEKAAEGEEGMEGEAPAEGAEPEKAEAETK